LKITKAIVRLGEIEIQANNRAHLSDGLRTRHLDSRHQIDAARSANVRAIIDLEEFD